MAPGPLRQACALASVWELGRCGKKDCLAFGQSPAEEPVTLSWNSRGRVTSLSRPEGSGHHGPHGLRPSQESTSLV